MTAPTVLVVDDHVVNRTVLRCMLETLALPPQEAGDGAQAVAMAQAIAYDLIFMDCMMPVMDGLEAARAIRAGGPSAKAWIIAVTANTLGHDRERCLAAGMDDYIAKPFTLDILHQALQRWGAACRPGWNPVQRPEPTPPDESEVDFTGMRQLAALAGPAAMRQVVEVFLDGLTASIEEAWRVREDANRLRATAHRIKGACASVGLEAAHRQALVIEQRAASGELDGMPAQLDRLALLMRNGSRRLEALIGPVSALQTGSRDRRPPSA